MAKSISFIKVFGFLAFILFFFLTGCANEAAVPPTVEPTRDPVLEKAIEQELEKMNPAAVSVYQEATIALDSNDLEKSKKLYEQVLVLAPNFSTAYRRLGYIALNTNDIVKAEELSRKAVDIDPSSYNQSSLAFVLLQKNTPADNQQAFNFASSAVKLNPDDDQANLALAISAGAINNVEIMREADERLLSLTPNSPFAHYFSGIVAASDGKWEKAEEELLFAQKLGLDPAITQEVLSSGITRNAILSRILRWGWIALVIWLFGLGSLFASGTFLSQTTIRTLSKAEPTINIQVQPDELRIRSIYRMVINVLSLYFYISIPFVILLLFIIVAGAFYIFLVIGSIPIQLAIVLIIMLLASLLAILRSLFFPRKDILPGRQLSQMDAPELWAMVKDVANKLGTRPVDAIYLTPFVEIAVNERGSILQKFRGAGQRNLILGMGAISVLNQGQFAAILAHEYGHFSNKDTAGGDLAFQAYGSLQQMAQLLIRSGSTQIFNPAWLFVMGYQRIFLRITLGASRLQEILADRYAAMTYGSQNFIEGLQEIVRQTIAFPMQAEREIQKLFELKQPVNNLYNLSTQESEAGELQQKLDEAMKRHTSQYDSHPALQERIAWIERLNTPYSFAQENNKSALRLFPNAEEFQQEMTKQIMNKIRR